MRLVMMALICLLVIGAVGSCSKDKACSGVPASAEDTTLIRYDTSHGIVATKDPSGLYYSIVTPGGIEKPTINSLIRVRYTGKKMDDTVFEQGDNLKSGDVAWALSGLVEGWQIAIPYIGRGGKILITIPSSMGYGCQGSGAIGANEPLHFEIELVDFQ